MLNSINTVMFLDIVLAITSYTLLVSCAILDKKIDKLKGEEKE
jgi:hypothetical protein